MKGAPKAATCDGITVWEWPSGVSLAGQAEARRRRLQMGSGGGDDGVETEMQSVWGVLTKAGDKVKDWAEEGVTSARW